MNKWHHHYHIQIYNYYELYNTFLYHVVDNVLLTEGSSYDVTDSTHSLITYNDVIEGVDHLS